MSKKLSKNTTGRATQHGVAVAGFNPTLTARRVNREIERLSKRWTNAKRLRMAVTFESWALYLRDGAR